MSKEFEALWKTAQEAGQKAVEALQVRPMIVTDTHSGQQWYEADGVCGFAWVNVKPGTSKFAKWLKAQKIARTDDYYKGVTIWISDFNQSMQKKEAYARAVAKVFSDAGIQAYAASRMD